MLPSASSDKRDTIYLDNAATTPLSQEVFEAMLPYLKGTYGNPSSIHHKGREAFDALVNAREEIARALRARANEIIFTSGGTEANNLALRGILTAPHNKKKHVLISAIEHASILECGKKLSTEGFEVEILPVDAYGRVQTEEILGRVRPDTALISIIYGNNEIGTVEPITEIARALHTKFPDAESRPLLHTDACQAAGQLPITPSELGVDLMSINSGKIYGPKGVGLLYVRNGITLSPLLIGGEQEHGRRAGTENIAGIIGFAKALTLAVANEKDTATSLTTLRDTFIKLVLEKIPDTVVNGHRNERLANNAHFSFSFIEGEALILLLDSYGICASTGSACNAHNLAPSHVLRALGQPSELIHGSIRFTLGRDTTFADLTYTADILSHCVTQLRAISPLSKNHEYQ